ASWRDAAGVAAIALGLVWTTSYVIEIAAGHASREQAIPMYWDASRVDVFVVNALVIAGFVPIVEESLCRGLAFFLLGPFGTPVAIAGSAIAFALAHGAVLDLPWVLVTGLGLGYVRARSGSLYPSVLLHATINGVAVLAAALIGSAPVT